VSNGLLCLCFAALPLAGGSRVPDAMEDHADWRSLPEVKGETSSGPLQPQFHLPLTALRVACSASASLRLCLCSLRCRRLRRLRAPPSVRPSRRRRRCGTASAS
jgi:hypothetical protein